MSVSSRGAPSASVLKKPVAPAPVELPPDEVSEPFFKGLGVVFVEVEDETPAASPPSASSSTSPSSPSSRCDLCSFAKKHPPDEPNPHPDQAYRWGVLHNVMENKTMCKEPNEEDQHAFHYSCLRAFVLAKKAHFRKAPGCPVCDKLIIDKSKLTPAAAALAASQKKAEHKSNGDDDDAFGDDDGLEEVGQTGGKKRKRDKINYIIWVHIRQATGLKLVGSEKTMNPVAYVTAFGKTVNTARGDGGKTFSCVWNEAFSFQKVMDEEEFSKETIQIRIEDHAKLWSNTLIGFVKFQADLVQAQPNHEFYQLNYPIVNMASKKKDQAVTMQGQLEVSVSCMSEEDMKLDPKLPAHIYDAEVEMWAELQQKQEVMDFDINKNYLQNNLDLKAAQDLAKTATAFDIVHVRVYKAEDLPKLDKLGSSWCDAFVELEYKGLMDKGAKLKSKPILKTANPAWNMEFTIPIIHGQPLTYNSFELVVKNHNTLSANDWIGKCMVNISDILALPPQSPPIWKSLYQDLDGKAPTYRGRVLVEFFVETNQKDAKMFSIPCNPCREDLIPPAGSYRLDFELFEGLHLLEDYSDYQVDVTLGHTLTGGGGSNAEPGQDRAREIGGKCWATIESDSKHLKGANKTIVPFLQKRSLMIHNLPYPRSVDHKTAGSTLTPEEQQAEQARLAALAANITEAPSSPTGSVKPHLDADTGRPTGFTGDASQLAFNSIAENFNKNTTLLDYQSMMPDLIIYVSKKGGESGRKNCVGYLRIPLNSLKRPTENWEHGEDLTIFPHLWDADKASARCLPLKPLVELYQLTSGFLLFKATLTPVSGAAASAVANQMAASKLEPIPRQKYKFVANVFQAKDMASVDPSGLSSPFATVQIGDVVVKSKPRTQTCFPLWFEALTASVELPVNLLYAPDFAVTCYHYKSSLFKFNDPSIFMGRADIPAITASTTQESSPPAWYPLQFEEHQYGNILLSFRLTPEEKIFGGIDIVQSGIERLIDSWENYAVEVSALDIRGKMATKHKLKKIDPTFQIECWDDIQNYKASEIASDKFTVYIRKPANPVFYSSINFRIYEGKDLTGVTSIPVSKILRSGMSWYKLMELILREESMLCKRVIRKWRSFIRKKHFVDPRKLGIDILGKEAKKAAARLEAMLTPHGTHKIQPPPPVSTDGTSINGDEDEHKQGTGHDHAQSPSKLTDEDEDESHIPKASRFDYLKKDTANGGNQTPGTPIQKVTEKTALTSGTSSSSGYASHDIHININDDDPVTPESRMGEPTDAVKLDDKSKDKKKKGGKDSAVEEKAKEKVALANANKPREGQEVDENGVPIYKEEDLYKLKCEQLPDKDAGNPFETHWRVGCEYELLPLVNDPFLENELYTGKDEIHSTFLDKLFARGKHTVGKLRAHFYGYRIGNGKLPGHGGAVDKSSIARVNPLFDEEKYFHPTEYCVRVYILRGHAFSIPKGKASACDPFITISMAGGETFKSEVKDGTLHPEFYQVFDFNRIHFPAIDTTLTLTAYNDNTIFSPDEIGSTEIALENRLFSKVWNAGQKPIERRVLKKSKTGRLGHGLLEVVVQILPMHEAGTRALDYLLTPPRRIPWELRITLLNCRKVTMKKIYKNDGDCCCYDCLAPPNQSDIKLIAALCGSGQDPQATDTHPRSIDGTGMFNWRCKFDIDLPAPKLLSNIKVQVWNINWKPNDCIAEAIIPLWGFFELARRELEKNKDDPDKWIRTIPRQWVSLKHPQNSDVGEVEMEIELLPKDMAEKPSYKAAAGEDCFDIEKNAPHYVLPRPNRPDDSFAWYRLDKQICWRCKYCFKKIRWYLLGLFILLIAALVGLVYAHKEGYI